MLNKLKKQGLRRRVEMSIEQDLLKVVLQRVDLILKTSLGLRRGFLMKSHKASDDRLSKPKPKKGRDTSSSNKKPTCGKCGKKLYGDCVKGKDNYFLW